MQYPKKSEPTLHTTIVADAKYLKAIQTNYYAQPHEHIIHEDVVEVGKKGYQREFKCLCCGFQWTQNINSPQILEEEVEKNLKAYYGDEKIIYYSQLKD